jgi:16S rRNA (guanine527-N7)-methyltransferase
MTEDEAIGWVRAHYPDAVIDRLQRLAMFVADANQQQNLIAPSTVDHLWSRHIVDSLQLLAFAQPGLWLDIGSGAGFPGMAIAAAEPEREIVLVEPRRLRVEHLIQGAATIGVANVTVKAAKIETVRVCADVISARAVASTAALFEGAFGCAKKSTVWLLPKGRNAEVELADARKSWQGVFHVEQSITSADSKIVVAQGVRPR